MAKRGKNDKVLKKLTRLISSCPARHSHTTRCGELFPCWHEAGNQLKTDVEMLDQRAHNGEIIFC